MIRAFNHIAFLVATLSVLLALPGLADSGCSDMPCCAVESQVSRSDTDCCSVDNASSAWLAENTDCSCSLGAPESAAQQAPALILNQQQLELAVKEFVALILPDELCEPEIETRAWPENQSLPDCREFVCFSSFPNPPPYFSQGAVCLAPSAFAFTRS